MAGYANIQGRGDLYQPTMLPDQLSKEIIQTVPQKSVIMARARKARMSTKVAKQPVLASLPDAYWVNGDTGLKETTKMAWSGVSMTAEEMAVIVPIPDALVADSEIPIWEECKPLIVEAAAKLLDAATIFGTNKPASWPAAIIPGAIAAGNTVEIGTGADIGVDFASLGEKLALDGFDMNGFIARPGMRWSLIGLRDASGRSIYQPPQQSGLNQAQGAGTLYGYPLNEVTTGVWNPATATMLGADWDKIVVGIRQDITFQMFSEGVLSDDTGKVILNLMQQDSKALRMVFRCGFQVANPITRLNSNASTRYPAGVLVPAA